MSNSSITNTAPDSRQLAVDKVFCISIRERDDRRTHLLEETKQLNLDLEFVITEKDDENPERGCFRAHRRCAEIALSRGYRRILILEDDARLESNSCYQRRIPVINRFLANRNPEIFYLGYILGRTWLTSSWRILGCNVYGGHAYILSRTSCERLSRLDYAGEAIDNLYRRVFSGYGIYPAIFSQWPSSKFESDTQKARIKAGNVNVMDDDYWERQRRKLNIRNILKWSLERLGRSIRKR